jgi:hypothetical protein
MLFALGALFGALVTCAALFGARYFRVDRVLERPEDFAPGQAVIITEEQAQDLTTLEDAKDSDKTLTFDDLRM